MQITLNQQDQYLEILPEGRIDAVTAGEVDSKCQDALKDSVGGVVLNFSAVPYISSAGLRSVLKLAKSAQAAKRQLICCAMQPAVFEVFRLSGFTSFLKIVATAEEAYAKFS